MGSLFSRPVKYVYTKVDNTREAIRVNVQNTSNAIRTKVNAVKTGVTTRVVNTRDYIVNTVTSIRDRIYQTINNVKNRITTAVDNTVASVVTVKNGVVTRVVDTRNAVATRATNAKDRCYARYRKVRDAKLTRTQKLKYAVIFACLAMFTVISTLVLWDVYQGDYDSAQKRIDGVWNCTRSAAEVTWANAKIAGDYMLYGTEIFLERSFHWGKILSLWIFEGVKFSGYHLGQGAKSAGHYIYIGGCYTASYVKEGVVLGGQYTWGLTKFGAQQFYAFTCLVADYLAYGTVVTFQYIGEGAKIGFSYCAQGSKIALDGLVQGSIIGAQHAVQGSKFAAAKTVEGFKYWNEHGTVALKEGLIKLFFGLQWLVCYLFWASCSGVVWLWELLKTITCCVAAGSYSGTFAFIDGTKFLVNKTYHGTISAAEWTHETGTATCNWTAWFVQYVAESVQSGAFKAADTTGKTSVFLYTWFVFGATAAYTGAGHTIYFIYSWIVSSAQFSYEWTTTVITKISYGLYVGLNQYGLRWLYQVGNYTVQMTYAFGGILAKFFKALGIYVGNFSYVTGNHICNIFYIFCAFIYRILTAIGAFTKVISDALVYCITSVFGAVIWFLQETVFAYMFMLHKYNIYREILFVVFIAIISLYCSGLMRDRREGEGDSGEESSEGDDVADGVEKKTKKNDLNSPPPYTKDVSQIPTYEEAIETQSNHSDESEIDPDYLMDEEMPDFMDTSGSENELDPFNKPSPVVTLTSQAENQSATQQHINGPDIEDDIEQISDIGSLSDTSSEDFDHR